TSKNPLRIVVLGDSIAAGMGIERTADVFPARLESELTRRGHAAEVLNFAVSGYNTRQEIETLKDDALAFSPDVVLLAYCLNDHRPPEAKIVDGLRQQAEGRVAVAPGAADRLLTASAVYRLLRYRGAHAGDDALAHLDGEGAAAGVQSAAAFDELAALGREHGFETLVAVFPELRSNLARYPYGNRHRHLAALSAERGFAHLDLLWAYRECQANGETNLALDRYHPSVAGHECAALALADFLEGGLFQPPSP
ncbi:MAG TPA: SGNH/GDSL hydrolase family protein, partial [Thermoanaerobaculia bacterium]|nr:SGNH/GDSL hydrolase family protein [Thermoanaerobaculia bacterium]